MWFELSSDIKSASRALTRAPGTSALIVFTLAFAIAAATIGFSVADLALFRGLPVDDNAKVVSIFVSDTHGANLRARVFTAGEDAEGAAPVAVLSHHFWRDEMNSRPDAIGQTLQVGRQMVTVVGVLSPDIEFGNLAEIDLWRPLALNPDGPRDLRNLRFIARLRDGASFEQAAAEIQAIGDALAAEHPGTNAGWRVRLVPIRDLTGGEGFWVVIALFLLSIGLLMAIATANVSNLVMVRTLARARELAVRSALGARKGRLIRQFVAEGMLLSVIAAALSVGLTLAALRVIGAFSEEAIFQQMNIDSHELGFIALLTLICPLMFSLSPIRALSRPDLRHVLAAGGSRGSTAVGRSRGVLVVVQVALAVILLTVSSLALRSTRAIYSKPTGLETGKLLVFGLEFNAALPGVESLAVLNALPILGDQGPVMLAIDGAVASADEVRPTAVVTASSHDVGRARLAAAGRDVVDRRRA